MGIVGLQPIRKEPCGGAGLHCKVMWFSGHMPKLVCHRTESDYTEFASTTFPENKGWLICVHVLATVTRATRLQMHKCKFVLSFSFLQLEYQHDDMYYEITPRK